MKFCLSANDAFIDSLLVCIVRFNVLLMSTLSNSNYFRVIEVHDCHRALQTMDILIKFFVIIVSSLQRPGRDRCSGGRTLIENQDVYPRQSTTVFVKGLVKVNISLTQRGAKRPKDIASVLVAGTNGTLSSGTYCRSIQFGDLYLEEAGMPQLCEGHCGQPTGLLRSPAPLPV